MTDQNLLNRTILACRKILFSPAYRKPVEYAGERYTSTLHKQRDWDEAQDLLDKLSAVNDPILHESGFYCVECKSLCRPYEQGLCCDCDQPWITEVIWEKDYPDKWIPVEIRITK